MSTTYANFEKFLEEFMPIVESKSKMCSQAAWILETTGSSDAADILAGLSTELRLLFSNKEIYQKLLEWQKDKAKLSPVLQRELELLILGFKSNMVSKELLQEVSQKEAELSRLYANFRPTIDGKPYTENEILTLLKTETDPQKRKQAWEASKQIGKELAPKILELVKLRNKIAKELGYENYFSMQLDLQEVNEKWLFDTFKKLDEHSASAYTALIQNIEEAQKKRFHVDKVGPWAWSDPFSQEDPLGYTLDALIEGQDLVAIAKAFYQKMGLPVENILSRSDLYERAGKNQHAFCINIDKNEDVRTLNNLRPTLRWMDTLLHELGHASYELGFNKSLPFDLRSPPHMIPTEAMALIAGRQAYSPEFYKEFVKLDKAKEPLVLEALASQKRRQLIFSRWVFVMTFFEKELYSNPDQDLNALWWKLVERYQKIPMPANREKASDWAAKYHIGLAPVYYYSYLVGEMFASALKYSLKEQANSSQFWTPEAGKFLKQNLFYPGSLYKWDKLIETVLKEPLTDKQWIEEFAK